MCYNRRNFIAFDKSAVGNIEGCFLWVELWFCLVVVIVVKERGDIEFGGLSLILITKLGGAR